MTIWYAVGSANMNSWGDTTSTIWNDAAGGAGNYMAGASFAAYNAAHLTDSFDSNGYTVTVNCNYTATLTRSTGTKGGSGTGGFTVSTAVIITSPITGGLVHTLTTTAAAGITVTISGKITGSITASKYGLNINGLGTLALTGNVDAGSGSAANGIYMTLAGILTISGDILGKVAVSAIYGLGTITITGSITAGSTAGGYGINYAGTGTLTIINGPVTGGGAASAYAIFCNTAGATFILNNCNVLGNLGAGICNSLNGTTNITVNGNVTGGGASGANGIYMNGAGTLTVNGNVTVGSTALAYGIYNTTAIYSKVTINGSLIATTVCGTPVAGPFTWVPSATDCLKIPTTGGTIVNYYPGGCPILGEGNLVG